MGRKRKHNRHLPRRLQEKAGAYYFLHDIPKSAEKPKGGIRWELLRNEDGTKADYGQALIIWAKYTGGNAHQMQTLGDAFDRYKREVLPKKTERSRKNNLQQFKALYKVFRDQRPKDLRPSDVYAFMDARRNKKGRHVPIQANREKELLSHVCAYLVRWGVLDSNPCSEVNRFSQPARTRDVESSEFEAVSGLASDRMQCAMEIALITGMREGDIMRLGRQNADPKGVVVTHGKTKKRIRYLWNPRLETAWKRLLGLQDPIPTFHLFAGRRGQPLSESGFQSEWQRLMAKALKTGAIQERFTFHDIRAMAGGTHPVAHELLGNSPEVAERVYKRKPRDVMPNS